MKRNIRYLFRLAVFVLVFYVLLRHADFSQLRGSFSDISILFLFPALMCYILRYTIQGGRWYLAAKAHEKYLAFKTTVRAQFEIAFLEIIFPLPDSEDSLKLAYMYRKEISLAQGTAIILFDRMIGISVLLILLPFSFYFFSQKLLPTYLQQDWILVLILLVCFPFAVFHRQVIRCVFYLINSIPVLKTNWVQVLDYELKKKISIRFIFLGLFFTLFYASLGTFAAWLLVKAVHAEISILPLLAGIPLFYLSAIIPLSFQGLGLYETALIFVIKEQGVNFETAIAVGLLHFIFHIIVIVTGGALYLMNTDQVSIGSILLSWTNKLIRQKNI